MNCAWNLLLTSSLAPHIEALMAFSLQSKKAWEREARWNTAGKVPVVFPQNLGRLNKDQMEVYMLQSFKKF